MDIVENTINRVEDTIKVSSVCALSHVVKATW